MDDKMENAVDGILDSICGHFQLEVFYLNIIVGLLLIVWGFALLKKRNSDGKRVFGWISLSIGCVGMLSGAVQLLRFVMS